MIEFERKRRRDSSIELTPLIDVVFQLLVFFLLTSTMANHAIPVELPEAETGERGEDQALTISIDREGALFVDRKPVTREQLRAMVHTANDDGGLQAVVSADRRAEHGHFVEVLDMLRREGVTRFGIEVQPAAALPSGSPTTSTD